MNEKSPSKRTTPDELRQKMKRWRQANPQATLTEIEEAVEAELAQMRQALVEEMAQAEAATEEAPACPECGEAMVKNGRRKRRLQSKEGQRIELHRQQWRCLPCGTTLFPPG